MNHEHSRSDAHGSVRDSDRLHSYDTAQQASLTNGQSVVVLWKKGRRQIRLFVR